MTGKRPRLAVLAWLGLCAALAASLMPGAALAACGLDIRRLGGQELGDNGRYDPFAQNVQSSGHDFELRRSGGACEYIVAFSEGDNPSGGMRRASGPGGYLNYDLFASVQRGARLLPIDEASLQNTLSGTSSGNNRTFGLEFYAHVPPGQFVAPGRYRDRIEAAAYEGPITRPELRGTQRFDVTIQVLETVDVRLSVDGYETPLQGARQTIDFGVLERGMQRHFELRVAGNVDYDVELESENRGRLVNPDAQSDNTVDYTLAIGGGPLQLSNPLTLPYASAHNDKGNTHRFTVTIGNVDRAIAGNYSDWITITVTSR